VRVEECESAGKEEGGKERMTWADWEMRYREANFKYILSNFGG
jgi:hypothetical protein